MNALGDQVDGSSKLHIVEKIGMDFMIQNAILNVPELTKLKVSGHLPQLHVNLSDTKFSELVFLFTDCPSLMQFIESLMRLIDIAIPRNDTDAPESSSQPHTRPSSQTGGYQLVDGPHDFDDGASFLTDATDLRRDEDGDFHDAIDDTSEVSVLFRGGRGQLSDIMFGDLRTKIYSSNRRPSNWNSLLESSGLRSPDRCQTQKTANWPRQH
jgi:hypothetical protein